MSATITYGNIPNVDEVMKGQISDELLQRANSFQTIRSGNYRLRATHVKMDIDDRERAPIRGRLEVRVRFEAFDPDTHQRVGSFYATLSPEEVYRETATGKRADGPSSLWANAAKALGAKDTYSILKGLAESEFMGKVDESFKIPGGEYINKISNPDERDELLKAGAEPSNWLRSLSAIK